MFKVYLFCLAMKDIYDKSEPDDSANILDLATKAMDNYDKASLLALRDGCYMMMCHIEQYIQKNQSNLGWFSD